nr:glycosyltransferase [uncultured Moellerella sp.]
MKKEKYTLQIGNFGGNLQQIDGQTIKTKLFGHLLDAIYYKTLKVDIYNYNIINYLILYIKLPLIIYMSSHVFIGIGKKGMRLITPWLIIWCLILRKKAYYYVIGGWIFELLSQKKYLTFFFKKFKAIFVELPSMIETGKFYNLENIVYFPNFRKTNFIPEITKNNDSAVSSIRLVYYSRVIKEKGIFIAVDAINILIDKGLNVSLDIFGPLCDNEIVKTIESINYINYKGILSPENDNLYHTLNKYDFMIFPTYYSGEGFPGAITDAFISGIPVIASNWKYNSEIITPEFNGDLFPIHDVNALCNILEKYYSLPKKIYFMKKNAFISSKKYSYAEAKKIFENIVSK